MKFSLLQENFNAALTVVSRFVSAKTQLPILSHILMCTDSGRLKLSATNLELGINYWLGAKVESEGTITLPVKEIAEFVSYLSPGKIDLDLNENNLLLLTSPKAQSSFTTTASSDFPELPQIDPKTKFEIDFSVLSKSIGQIAFSAAVDDARPVLAAIYCCFSPESILLAATDGFRLSTKEIKLNNPITLKDGVDSMVLLIPSRSLTEITKLSKSAKKIEIGLTSDEHQLVFVLEDLELVSRLIEGDYPDYKRIIPQSFSTKVLVGHDEFAQAIKIASVFARQSANVVKLIVKANSIDITANAPQIGQNKATVDAKVEGDGLEIAFNYKYISDFLSVCQGEEISIELNESLTPGKFTDVSNPDFTHIIMPVRIQD